MENTWIMPQRTWQSIPHKRARALTVAIQAGGKSTRMGRDKSFVPFQGRPMIEVVRDHVAGLGDELIVITNDPAPYAYLDLPIYGDIYTDHGPLGGIHSALVNAASPYVLMVACDMPWLNRDLLRLFNWPAHDGRCRCAALGQVSRAAARCVQQELPGAGRKTLEAGDLKITRFLSDVTVRFVDREEIMRFDPLTAVPLPTSTGRRTSPNRKEAGFINWK